MEKPHSIPDSRKRKQANSNINSRSDWQSDFSTIQEANKHLLETRKFCDIAFVLEDNQRINAHKFILMTRSSVFETMLDRWNPANSEIHVPETTFSAFNAFLLFLYTNEFVVQIEDALEVIYLAHKYNVTGLFNSCCQLLKSAISEENVIEIYQVAQILDQVELKEIAFEFILRNATSVLQDHVSATTTIDTLMAVLSSEKLNADEIVVFQAVIRWAHLICQEQSVHATSRNKRIIAEKIVPLIRFPLLSLDVFTEQVINKHHGFLDEQETMNLLEFISSEKKTKAMQMQLNFNCNQRVPRRLYSVMPIYDEMNQICYSELRSEGSTFQFTFDADVYVTALELNPDHVNHHFLRDVKAKLIASKGNGSIHPVSFVQIVRIPKILSGENLNKCSTFDVDLGKSRIKTLEMDPIRVSFDWPVKISANKNYKVFITNARFKNSSGNTFTGKSGVAIHTSRTKRTLCTFQFTSWVGDQMEREGIISKIHFTT